MIAGMPGPMVVPSGLVRAVRWIGGTDEVKVEAMGGQVGSTDIFRNLILNFSIHSATRRGASVAVGHVLRRDVEMGQHYKHACICLQGSTDTDVMDMGPGNAMYNIVFLFLFGFFYLYALQETHFKHAHCAPAKWVQRGTLPQRGDEPLGDFTGVAEMLDLPSESEARYVLVSVPRDQHASMKGDERGDPRFIGIEDFVHDLGGAHGLDFGDNVKSRSNAGL